MGVEDVVALSEKYNQSCSSLDYSDLYDISIRVLKADIGQIRRITDLGDSPNPDLCQSVRVHALAQPPGVYDDPQDYEKVLELFHSIKKFDEEDLVTAVHCSNFEVFLHILTKYFGGRVAIPDRYAEELDREYRVYESEGILNKILCIYPHSEYKFSPEVQRQVRMFMNAKNVRFAE